MKKYYTVCIFVVLNLFISTGFSQTITSEKKHKEITDTTYKCSVITVSGKEYKDVYIFGLGDSSIKVMNKDIVTKVLIKDICCIKFYRRGFWSGAAYGGGFGFLLGAIIGAEGVGWGSDGSQNGSFGESIQIGIILSIPFSLIGGALGAGFADDHLYVLSNSGFDEKKKEIRYLILENSDR